MRNREAINELLQSFLKLGIPGCGLTVSQHGAVLYQNTVGYADKENEIPFSMDTVYRIYSCSKPITIAAAMILLERGKILLTDPVEMYLPYFSKMTVYDQSKGCHSAAVGVQHPVTILDLMRMTSGFPYGGENNLTEVQISKLGKVSSDEPLKLQEFCKRLAEVPVCFEPGAHWMYGFGCDIIGALIEVVSGKSFGQFLKDEIFDPLSMDHTGFFFDEEKRKHLAAVYTPTENHIFVKEDSLDWQFEPGAIYESGGSGLLSNLADMTRFTQMLSCGGELDGVKILSRRAVELMNKDHLLPNQRADFDHEKATVWPNMLGYSFGLGCRTMVDPAEGGSLSSIGEFGWSGAAGTWSMADPVLGISAEYVHQVMPPDKNFQKFCHARLRNAIYGALT